MKKYIKKLLYSCKTPKYTFVIYFGNTDGALKPVISKELSLT